MMPSAPSLAQPIADYPTGSDIKSTNKLSFSIDSLVGAAKSASDRTTAARDAEPPERDSDSRPSSARGTPSPPQTQLSRDGSPPVSRKRPHDMSPPTHPQHPLHSAFLGFNPLTAFAPPNGLAHHPLFAGSPQDLSLRSAFLGAGHPALSHPLFGFARPGAGLPPRDPSLGSAGEERGQRGSDHGDDTDTERDENLDDECSIDGESEKNCDASVKSNSSSKFCRPACVLHELSVWPPDLAHFRRLISSSSHPLAPVLR